MLNLKNRRVQLAWLYVIAWTFVVAGLFASNSFSADSTGKWLKAILRFFNPDISPHFVFWLHWKIRKFAHFTEYAILALLCLRALLLSMSTQRRNLRAAVLALLYVLFVAIIDETRQAFSAERSGRAFDTLIDFSGAAVAVLLWWLFLTWVHSRKSLPRDSAPTETPRNPPLGSARK